MKRRIMLLVIMLLIGDLYGGISWARGAGHGGGVSIHSGGFHGDGFHGGGMHGGEFHGGGSHHSGFSFWGTVPFMGYPYYSYPYYDSNSYYFPPGAQQYPFGNWWYYCTDPQGYFPDIAECPSGWQLIEPHS